jgi:phenylalanyl-tRNA synthetase beta chain
LILPPDTPIGKKLEDVMPLNDHILDIEVTSNRADAMSVIGLAREGAAALGLRYEFKPAKPNLKSAENLSLTVKIEEPKLCSRYQAIVMTGVKSGPSPMWLQLRLLASGLRPISNLVDITNYILLEYGQPLHVFDYEKLSDKKIVVRRAKAGEKILALDGKTYELKPDQLVIADGRVPVAVAGIMGGEESAATAKTKTIVFEAANFNPVSVRKTARALNLHSDASSLYEKGLHPQNTHFALLRAIELTQRLAGGQAASPIIDAGIKIYKPAKIKLDTAQIKKHLGADIPAAKVKTILTTLGFSVSGGKILTVSVPWWRANDVGFDYDLIEEIARIYGYHNLPTTLPQGEIPVTAKEPILIWEENIKNELKAAGFTESINYSMVSEKFLAKGGFGAIKPLKVANPLNEDMDSMRTSLIPGILQNIADNIKSIPEIKIFELSNIYLPAKANELPDENPRLCGAIVSDQENSFFLAKGLAELLLTKLGLLNYEIKLTDQNCPLWQKQAAMDVICGGKFVGQFGLFAGEILENFGIDKPVAVFDFDFCLLASIAQSGKIYRPIPAFPESSRDLAIIVSQDVKWESISATVAEASPLLAKIEYLNTFLDKSLGENKKSLAFRMIFRAPDRTLKSEEIDVAVKKAISALESKFSALLR